MLIAQTLTLHTKIHITFYCLLSKIEKLLLYVYPFIVVCTVHITILDILNTPVLFKFKFNLLHATFVKFVKSFKSYQNKNTSL